MTKLFCQFPYDENNSSDALTDRSLLSIEKNCCIRRKRFPLKRVPIGYRKANSM